jgi:hypothetical protein
VCTLCEWTGYSVEELLDDFRVRKFYKRGLVFLSCQAFCGVGCSNGGRAALEHCLKRLVFLQRRVSLVQTLHIAHLLDLG